MTYDNIVASGKARPAKRASANGILRDLQAFSPRRAYAHLKLSPHQDSK